MFFEIGLCSRAVLSLSVHRHFLPKYIGTAPPRYVFFFKPCLFFSYRHVSIGRCIDEGSDSLDLLCQCAGTISNLAEDARNQVWEV